MATLRRREFITTGAVAAAAGSLAATATRTASSAVPAPATAAATSATASANRPGFPGDKSYAATAKPRPWTTPQRASAPIAIDMHTHWAPESYLKAKAELGQPDFLDPINHDMARRKKLMEALGIKTSVLTLGGFRPWQWVTAEQGARIASGVNDTAIEVHKAYPDSFLAGIELNCSDPSGSLKELNRVAGKAGMVCVHLPTSLASRDYLFEPAFAPVLARTQELGLPIWLHPLDGEPNWFGGKRLADSSSGVDPNAPNAAANRFPGLTNSLGNSLEIAVCIAKLIVSGTLDLYPNLTFMASHGGGAIPYVAGRIEGRGNGGKAKLPTFSYLRRFYYDAATYWVPSLHYLATMVGADRIILGTDNMYGPGDNQMANQPNSVIDQAFNDEDRDLVLRGNLKRLFKL
jgi:aminocarboxymuconate-semialdehyde decarboxylase